MTIIQATRHPMNFARFSGDVVTGASIPTGGSAWDANYVKMVMRMPGAAGGVAWRHIFPVALTDHWYQIEWYTDRTPTTSNGNVRMAFTDSAGNVLFRILGDVNPAFQIWTGTGAVYTTLFNFPALADSTLYTLGFYFRLLNSGGLVEVYLNGTLVGSFAGDTLPTSTTSLVRVDYVNTSVGSGAGRDGFISGGVITTNENPWGVKVKTHVLTADGTYTGMVGPYTNVDDATPDTADIISASATALKRSMILDDLPTLGGSDVVRGLYVSTMARCGATGPSQLSQGVRASAADQVAAAHALTTGWKVYNDFLETNSVTSAEFTPTEVNAAELLLET